MTNVDERQIGEVFRPSPRTRPHDRPGGGSNAMGLFHEFVEDTEVRMIGVEAAGFGIESGKHAATLTKGEVGVLHGAMSYLLQDDDGQIIEPHSISAGLDYPGVGPEHSFLKDLGRAEYYSITDEEAPEGKKHFRPCGFSKRTD
ncbi:hypothetical protein LXL04_037452 [Taraxacum kok-saghyz]